MQTQGKFITFEGGEGSGKSTQVERLTSWLNTKGIAATTTREPGGSSSAEAIRSLLVEGAIDRWQPISEVLLHNAARAEHISNLVSPALGRGDWVISDRYADSTMAYQGYAHGFDQKVIQRIHNEVVGDVLPDLTLILDIPVPTGLDRAGQRQDNEDRYERMGLDFHERVRHGFLEIAKQNPTRCVVVDAQQTVDKVSDAIIATVAGRLDVDL